MHHGIDLGDGTVAHYLEGRQILRSPLDAFSRGQPITPVPYPEGACSPVGVTLRRAMSRLGEQNYNLLFNNCEHFAHWCKTGRHRSPQVEDWVQASGASALAVGQFVQAALLSGARLLLRQGIDEPNLEKGREVALRTLAQLDGLRRSLQERLEGELARAELRWGQQAEVGDPQFLRLRQAAQNLADQLSQVEEMEARLERMFQTGEGR
jgi:hypothetical protein